MVERKITRYLLLSVAALTCLLAPWIIGQAGFQTREKSARPASSPSPPETTASPASVSKQPEDKALALEIDRVLDESELTKARWGVFVTSMKDGRVLYSRNGDRLFTPASNMKVYTTAAALDLLGTEYRWRTSVYADKPPGAGGVIEGNLTLFGRGAPDLNSFGKQGLTSLADRLYQQGIRRVSGNIVGDQSYFSGELYGLGWQWNDLQWYFGAEPSALTVDENSLELKIAPADKVGSSATLTLNRETNYLHLTNNTTTLARGDRTTIGINRGLSDSELRVWGDFPIGGRPFTAYLSVPNPALWAATLFKKALITRGIKVDGEVSSRDFRVAESQRFDPQKAIELAQEESGTLTEIVRRTNKESNNLYAELILRTLGKERGASAPDPDPRKNRERGDDEAGAAVVKAWLDRSGIPSDGLAIRDGSGLSRLDLVTPEATSRMLAAIAKTNAGSAFRDSLPIAGRDGTLSGRLRSWSGRVVAKTGTLTYTNTLSGYATREDGEILAFSIFCNDASGHSSPTRIIDQIVGLMVSGKHQSTSK
jgi:D-alanyl-D-alanine carboxypeptidase/D-alanyl-D-alanine-endopeptidase (penicillin-binding protein 4)